MQFMMSEGTAASFQGSALDDVIDALATAASVSSRLGTPMPTLWHVTGEPDNPIAEFYAGIVDADYCFRITFPVPAWNVHGLAPKGSRSFILEGSTLWTEEEKPQLPKGWRP